MTFSQELATILKEQLEIYKALEKVTYEKTHIIINNDVETLEQVTKKEEGLINRLGIAEEKRLKLMDSWGLDMNISIGQIIEKAPDDTEELIELKRELTTRLRQIGERNTINNELINDNLEWLDFNMNLISNAQTSTIYGKGKDSKGVNDSLFDRKV